MNKNGQFESTEYFDNGWGQGQWITHGQLTPALDVGTYAIRLQFQDGSSGDNIHLEWIEVDTVSTLKGHINGPSVIGASIQPGSSYQGPYTNRLDIDFSGALDTSTLTPANVRLRYSPDPTFFDSNDAFVADADSTIAWNPMLHRATFQAATALKAGYYLIELNGSSGGIRNTAGVLLDGEFLTNYVAGNTNILSPSRQLSGNGLPGGDYRAAFSVASALDLTLSSANVAENSGTTLVTVTRNDSATNAITVSLTSSDVTAITVPTTVTIPAAHSRQRLSSQASMMRWPMVISLRVSLQ